MPTLSGNECLSPQDLDRTEGTKSQFPLVSVVMGIYNCADTLPQAVESILLQTYPSLELVMCDDGSSDDTFALAKQYANQFSNVTVLKNPINQGLAPTLNRCISVAKGKLIARMDGDDQCAPDRIMQQFQFLVAHPEYDVVGTAMQYFDETGVWGMTSLVERPNKRDFLRGSPFAHATTVFRRSAFDLVGGYSEDSQHWRVEDFELWRDMYANGIRGANLPQPLYAMRNDRAATGRRSMRARQNEAGVLRDVVRSFGLPRWQQLRALKPIAVGMLPTGLYELLYRIRNRNGSGALTQTGATAWRPLP